MQRSAAIRAGAYIVSCLTCGISHQLPPDPQQSIASQVGFVDRHLGHQLTHGRILPDSYKAQYGIRNADVKVALQSVQTMTVTNLHSLTSSSTGGWQSAVVDNTSNLFLDAWLMVTLDFANTAPGSQKAVVILSYGGIESGTYTSPATGSEGTITLVDVTTTAQRMKWVTSIPYTTQDEAISAGPYLIAPAHGGALPPYWGVVAMNVSNAAFAGSGNAMKYRGLYATVI